MNALHNRVIFLLLMSSTGFVSSQSREAASLDEPECAQWGGVKASETLYFVDSRLDETPQNALLNIRDDIESPTWIRAFYEGNTLRFENKMQGFGLPFTIYHVKAEWVMPDDTVLEIGGTHFPDRTRCQAISLFPGQISRDILVKSPESSEALKLRVKVWTSFF